MFDYWGAMTPNNEGHRSLTTQLTASNEGTTWLPVSSCNRRIVCVSSVPCD
jgi:hypothetical protein